MALFCIPAPSIKTHKKTGQEDLPAVESAKERISVFSYAIPTDDTSVWTLWRELLDRVQTAYTSQSPGKQHCCSPLRALQTQEWSSRICTTSDMIPVVYSICFKYSLLPP